MKGGCKPYNLKHAAWITEKGRITDIEELLTWKIINASSNASYNKYVANRTHSKSTVGRQTFSVKEKNAQ
jgi:hypothetical protein